MSKYYKARLIATNEIIEVKFNDGWIRWTEPKAWLNREEFEILEEIPQEVDSLKEITIEGWIARDEDGFINLFNDKPIRDYCDRSDVTYGFWDEANEHHIELPTASFPSVTWKSEPKKVRITITPIEE